MDNGIDLGSFEFPKNTSQLPVVSHSDTLLLHRLDSPNVVEILSDDEIELLGNARLHELIIDKQKVLAERAIGALGDLYLTNNIEFAQATGETFLLRDSIEHEEHNRLYTAYLKLMNNELAGGLIENYRATKDAINNVAAKDLTPVPKPVPKPVQTQQARQIKFADWLFGREAIVDDD